MRLLLVTPPMIQLNTPYPATAYLTGFLRLHSAELGLEVSQADASLTFWRSRMSRHPLEIVRRNAHANEYAWNVSRRLPARA